MTALSIALYAGVVLMFAVVFVSLLRHQWYYVKLGRRMRNLKKLRRG